MGLVFVKERTWKRNLFLGSAIKGYHVCFFDFPLSMQSDNQPAIRTDRGWSFFFFTSLRNQGRADAPVLHLIVFFFHCFENFVATTYCLIILAIKRFEMILPILFIMYFNDINQYCRYWYIMQNRSSSYDVIDCRAFVLFYLIAAESDYSYAQICLSQSCT